MKAAFNVLVLALLLAGCATTPEVDWTSRLGSYTYQQALAELGQPQTSSTQIGEQTAEWLVRRGAPNSAGGPPSTSLWGRRPPRTVHTTTDQYLRLTFGKDGKLSAYKHDWR